MCLFKSKSKLNKPNSLYVKLALLLTENPKLGVKNFQLRDKINSLQIFTAKSAKPENLYGLINQKFKNLSPKCNFCLTMLIFYITAGTKQYRVIVCINKSSDSTAKEIL